MKEKVETFFAYAAFIAAIAIGLYYALDGLDRGKGFFASAFAGGAAGFLIVYGACLAGYHCVYKPLSEARFTVRDMLLLTTGTAAIVAACVALGNFLLATH